MNEYTVPVVVAVIAAMGSLILGVINIYSSRKKTTAEVLGLSQSAWSNSLKAQSEMQRQINELQIGLDAERTKRRVAEARMDEQDKIIRAIVGELEKYKRGTQILIGQLKRAGMMPEWEPDPLTFRGDGLDSGMYVPEDDD